MDVIQKKVDIEKLYGDVCVIIENARENAYRTINVQLTLRNWLVGERVAKEDLQGEERATYGKQIVADLSKKLTEHYGAGFDRVSIYNYIRFYRMFPEIVDAVSQQSKPDPLNRSTAALETLNYKLETATCRLDSDSSPYPQHRCSRNVKL